MKKILISLLCVVIIVCFMPGMAWAEESMTFDEFFEQLSQFPTVEEIEAMDEEEFLEFYNDRYAPIIAQLDTFGSSSWGNITDEQSAIFEAFNEKSVIIDEKKEELDSGNGGSTKPDPNEFQWEWQTQFYDFYDEQSGLAYKIKDNDTVMVAPYYERGQNGYGNTSYRYAYTGAKTIPAEVTNENKSYTVIGIDDSAFKDTQVTSVTMPSNSEAFTTIGPRAFKNCAITSITIPASVTAIGNGEWDGESFSGSKLQNVTFAENSKLETISRFTFARCSDLIKLDVPDSVTYIGPSAFADCTSLPSVTVPANTVIEPGTFNSYYKSSANDGEGNVFFKEGSVYQIQDGVLYDEDTLMNTLEIQENVTVPKGIKYIGDSAFKVSPGGTTDDTLKSITFPTTLEKIGTEAFVGNTGLTSLVIPEGVTEIGERAFAGCSNVTSVTIPSTVKTVGEGAFSGIAKLDSDSSQVAGLELPQTSRVNIGASLNLSLADIPEAVALEWSTSDANVAKVENGVVTGVAQGSATITVTAKIGNTVLKTVSCVVDVTSGSNSSFPSVSSPQKPTIEASEGATVTLNSTGTIATITVADGYELADVTVNGVSKGAVTTLTGLKTGDKVVVTARKMEAPDDNAALIEAVKNTRLVARSMYATAPSGKKSIKVYWFNKDGSELDFDGYEVYRSLKRNSGYGKTPFFKTTKERYFNTAVKKGNKYYYKVRGYKVIDGKKIYTEYSLKAWRTAK